MSLSPIYKLLKLQHNDDNTTINLEDPIDYSAKIDAIPRKASCFSSDKSLKCSLFRFILNCLGFVFILISILWIIFLIIMTIIIGVKVNNCLNPAYQKVFELNYNDKEVNGFDLSVISGSIKVVTDPNAEKITLRVVMYAPKLDLLNMMSKFFDNTDGIIKYSINSPSFDYSHCQFTNYYLTIPTHFEHPLSIKAEVLLGSVEVKTDRYIFENLDLKVSVGCVHADYAISNNLIRLEAKVGYVGITSSRAKTIIMSTHVGYIFGNHLQSTTAEVTTIYGGIKLIDTFPKEKLLIDSEMGLVRLYKMPIIGEVDARINYGHLYYSYSTQWFGNFDIISPYGFLTSSSSTKVSQNLIHVDMDYHIVGSVSLNNTLNPENIQYHLNFPIKSNVRLLSEYGSINFACTD